MPVSFGSAYYTVTSRNIEHCFYSIADKYPSVSGNSYTAAIPDAHRELGEITLYDSPKEASIELRKHIISATNSEVISLLVSIEMWKQEIESHRLDLQMTPKSESQSRLWIEQQIESCKELIAATKEQVSTLRKVRRQKPELTFR